MLAVLFCSLTNVAMLTGLGAGIVAGVWQARHAMAAALGADPLAGPVRRPAGPERSRRGSAVPRACPAG